MRHCKSRKRSGHVLFFFLEESFANDIISNQCRFNNNNNNSKKKKKKKKNRNNDTKTLVKNLMLKKSVMPPSAMYSADNMSI